jgi:hypothetical protein
MKFNRKKFRQQWNRTDELCPHCNNITKPALGLNRQNIRRLFSLKGNPRMLFLYLFMAIMVLLWWRDISVSREYVKQIETNQSYVIDMCRIYFEIKRDASGGYYIGNISLENSSIMPDYYGLPNPK